MPPKNPPADVATETLTPEQIAAWAGRFSEAERVTAVAVALAESGGRTTAISPVNSDGSRDYGVWQINSRAWAGLFDRYPNWWTADNASMARTVWDSQGWDAWSVYRNGKYRQHLAVAERAVGNPANEIGDDPGETTGATQEAQWYRDTTAALAQIGNAMAGIAQAVFKGAVWMADPGNWVRLALVGVGGALVVGALVMVAKPNKGVVAATLVTPKAAVKAVK